MKIPATVRGHECASRTCTKTLATKDTHISKSTKSCTKVLTQKCIRKKVHENTNYTYRTLIQINKHAQTHSHKWTCTNFEDTNAHQETCTKTLATKDTHISKSTKSCTKVLTQKCIRKKVHENTNYNPYDINTNQQTCTNTLVQMDMHKHSKSDHENTSYN
ncbi:hypothetical protein MIMGU_mgv11b020499mg [Erythranthe guttata]|uniref:Uncharacterized protein n=1 Tax=Erythranthe guttata TaxID=4155 RepID=A0A022R220_ERYGU|nr:hypothetical protein MIMGU_mgv11b020499mg [Erythranthe guttata]